MKALTNILTHLLTMLMILLTACSEEVAEVDNLSQPGQHIRVNLCVPDLKITSRADADGDIRHVTALAFSSANQLLKVETINTITKTNNNGGYNGSFDLTVPNGTQTIHFLANLPDDIKNQLPQSGGTQEEVLRGLISTDFNNLRYWGKATTYDGNTIPIETTLYRNMAQIAIAPCPTDTEFNQFPQDSLFIAGLDNPNTSGTLVPYNNGFNFDLNGYDYHTLPEGVEKRDKTPEEATPEDGYGPFIYVFEHDNPNDWDEGLFVICGIGRAFYKVALVDNNGNPYDIIRNHKYIIYVSDVDDYQSDDYRAMNYDSAFNKKPINLDVQQEVITPVNLSIKAETNNLTYSSTSTEVVTITVTVPAGVQQLTLNTPEFTIASGDTLIEKVSDNTYNIKDATKNQDVHFHLKLNNDNATNANIQVNGSGEKVTVTGDSTQINIYQRNNEVNGEIIWWQGAMLLDAADDATKIPFPYSYFTNPSEANYLPVGSTIRFNYTDVQNPWIQTANPTTWGQISEFRYDTNQVFLDITQAALDSINNRHNTAWNIDAAFVVQGGGRVLNQITLIPAVQGQTALAVTPETASINMDNGDTSATMTLTKPTDLQNIKVSIKDANSTSANKYFAIKYNTYTDLGYDSYNDVFNNIYDQQSSLSITFTPNSSIPTGTYTVSFTDNNNQQVNTTASISVVNTLKLQYNYNNRTLYLKDYNGDNNPTSLDVTIAIPDGSTLSQLTISANGFIIKQGENVLSENGNYTYTNNASTTFTFTPKSIGTYTISFSGTNDNLIVKKDISVKLEDKAPNEYLIYEGSGIAINEGYLLLGIGNGGNADSLRSKFVVDATLVVEFNCTIYDDWNKDNLFLYLQTNWQKIFKSYKYNEGDSKVTLSYKFTEDDFSNSTDNINIAGLKLTGSYVSVTKISLIPATPE